MPILTPTQKLSTARHISVKLLPYFGTAIRSLVPVVHHDIKTMLVSDDGRLFYDPQFVAQENIHVVTFAVAHETMHVIFNHGKQTIKAGIAPHTQLSEIANMAQDFMINQLLLEAGFKVPNWALLPGPLGYEKDLGWREYFNQIRNRINSGNEPTLQDLLQQPGPFGPGTGGPPGPPQPGRGTFCGSGAGNPHPDEPDYDPNAQDGDEDDPNAGKGESGDGQGEDAPNPSSIKGRSQRDWNRIRKDAAQQAHNASKGRGTFPGGLKRWADEAVKPPKIDWRSALARNVRKGIAWVKGTGDYRYSRPSRRQVSLGFGPGHVVLPCMVSPVPKIWCVIDTSGSMGDKQIMDSISEVGGILRTISGAELTFVSGDATVNDVVKVRSVEQVKQFITGGGGTDFRPPFELALKQPAHPRPNILVYLTDGMGPAPQTPPPGIHTIWVLVGPHRTPPCGWGDFVDLELQGKVHGNDAEASAGMTAGVW